MTIYPPLYRGKIASGTGMGPKNRDAPEAWSFAP